MTDSLDPTQDRAALVREAEALCSAATPGPWEWYPARTMQHLQSAVAGGLAISAPLGIADAAFIARARTLIPELLSLYRAAEADRVDAARWRAVRSEAAKATPSNGYFELRIFHEQTEGQAIGPNDEPLTQVVIRDTPDEYADALLAMRETDPNADRQPEEQGT
jgi:hypothetical protein